MDVIAKGAHRQKSDAVRLLSLTLNSNIVEFVQFSLIFYFCQMSLEVGSKPNKKNLNKQTKNQEEERPSGPDEFSWESDRHCLCHPFVCADSKISDTSQSFTVKTFDAKWSQKLVTDLHECLRSVGIPETGCWECRTRGMWGYIQKIRSYYKQHCSSKVCGRFLAQWIQYYYLINS